MSLSSQEEYYINVFTRTLGHTAGMAIFDAGRDIVSVGDRVVWYEQALQAMAANDYSVMAQGLVYKTEPVLIQTFIEDDFFLGKKGVIYSEVMEALIELNSGKYIEAVLTGGVGAAKALALDTPLRTKDGWKTMGTIQTGDVVFDENGKYCTVLQAHEVLYGQDCYRVTFGTGHSIIADGGHLWKTNTLSGRCNRRKRDYSKVRTTRGIMSTCLKKTSSGYQKNHSIPVTAPLQGEDTLLGIDPYTLGAWLGDGSTRDSKYWSEDEEIIEQIRRYYCVRDNRTKAHSHAWYIYGIAKSLRALGLLDDLKVIPKEVFTASFEQRLAVFQGLMDTDGTVDKRQGHCSFSQKYEHLGRGVYELAVSLGLKASFRQAVATQDELHWLYGYTYWVVRFHAPKELPVFRLSRKLRYQNIRNTGVRLNSSRYHYIAKVERVRTVPVRCITVDSPSKLYLAGELLVPTHNTTIAHYTTAYQLYILSCLRDPHKLFKLDSASEILFVFQSLSFSLAKNLEFHRFKALLEGSYYFRHVFTFDKDIESRLIFPNRIEVVPVSGAESATIGQNVIGGVLDEVNYMAVIERSRVDVDGGTYDQAWALYNSIARRRKTRFIVDGITYGMLCLVSSKRYPGQFTDVKMEEAQKQLEDTGSSDIFVYDKRVWDVKPEGTYSDDNWFYVFIGDDYRKPMILDDIEMVQRFSKEDRENFIIQVPGEYKIEFERDIINALREVAGVSTLAKFPFMPNINMVSQCFDSKRSSVFSVPTVVLGSKHLTLLKKVVLKAGPYLRFAHIDLAKSEDFAGLVIGHIDKFVSLDRGDTVETLPHIVIDGVLGIIPPRFGEINFVEIRKILYFLRNMGLPIKWVSLDSYQSVDTIQILKRKGFICGIQSMDVSMIPYQILKSALYDVRVQISEHDLLYTELRSLEYDSERGKVDHPASGSKDVADALAGVVYGLTTRREIWNQFGINQRGIPISLQIQISGESE